MELVRVLQESSNEDLEYLVNYIKEKADFTETLTVSPGYRAHHPNHSMYVNEIAHEIRLFGGYTPVNILRGEGPPYEEIVRDVANKVGADYEHYNSVERVEMKILLKIFNDAFDKMSAAEKNGIIKTFEQAGVENLNLRAGFPAAAILAQLAVKSSGFLAYQIAVIVANNVAKAVLGHGLKLATNAALTRAIGIFAGPIGWVITGLWTAISVSGPAYRVTIPCVCHVAYLRQKIQSREDSGGGE